MSDTVHFITSSATYPQATGKIVVFNAPFDDPENAIKYRQKGAIAAGKLGASAVLVRSYATFSLSTPHTGLMFYESGYPKIPAAEISIEDSELLNRLQQKGTEENKPRKFVVTEV